MSRKDCVSNRNTRIILTYVKSILGELFDLLDGIEYPKGFPDAESYFMNEDEWDTLDTYRTIYHRAKTLVADPNFFFNCGASSARYESWGSFRHFKRLLGSPKIAYSMVPSFNKNFNDTKEFSILFRPHKESGRVKAIFQVKFHDDIDPHCDYCSDPHIRGILSAAPEVWGLAPALVKQPLVEYDPVILLNQEFKDFKLNARMELGELYIDDPVSQGTKCIGKEVHLVPETLPGKYATTNETVFLGDYAEDGEGPMGVLLTEDVVLAGEMVLQKGTVCKAPYFILKVESEDLPLRQRLSYLFKFGETKKELTDGLMHNLNQSRMAIKTRNEALAELKTYSKRLEAMVEERTKALKEAQAQLIETEKRVLEHRITGGFAHEMRNALTGAQLEFKTTLDYKGQGKPSAQILRDAATTLLKNVSDLHEEYRIPREKIAALVLPELKTIAEIADHLSQVHAGVSSDLDRGLSITTQIRDYARMSEFRPGDEAVDLVHLLRSYGDRYSRDLNGLGSAIRWKARNPPWPRQMKPISIPSSAT